jgi:hypothetical protein
MRLHHRLGIADRAETRQLADRPVVAVLQIADDAEAELIAMLLHPLEHRPRQVAVAGDEHAIEVLARAMTPFDDRTNQRAAEDRQQHRADQKDEQRRARVQHIRRARPHPQQHAGEDDRRHHRADRHRDPLLGLPPRRPDPIQPLHGERERKHQRHQRQHLQIRGQVLLPLGDRDDLEVKTQQPRAEHGQVRRHRVVDQIHRRERSVFFLDHPMSR